jgi:hypothetical protein
VLVGSHETPHPQVGILRGLWRARLEADLERPLLGIRAGIRGVDGESSGGRA